MSNKLKKEKIDYWQEVVDEINLKNCNRMLEVAKSLNKGKDNEGIRSIKK